MKQIIQNKKYKKGIVFLLFVIIMVSIIILTFLSSCKTNKPSISTQVSGNLRDTATIKVNLENNAKWEDVSLTWTDGWTRQDENYTFEKQDENATQDEIVTVSLHNGNSINLNIPFNIKISGATMGDLRNGATIAITLIGGANWSDVSITQGSGWDKSDGNNDTHTFYKTNISATSSENVEISLILGNVLNFTIFADNNRVFINNANITNYLIPANTAIYTTESEASVYRFGHSLINLKAMSDDNNGATEFIIIDDIHFGFLIDPNMDCCLKTNNGSKIVIDSSTSNLYVTFVVIGRLNNFAGQIWDACNLLIDSSVYCRIVINADDENTVYGIIANKIGRGTHWNINGTFYIEARKNIGEINSCMMFVKDCDGALNIRGVFYLSSPNTNASIFLKIINLNSNGHIIYDGITIMSAIDVIEQNPENNCFICTNATSVGSTMAIHGAVFSYICINNIYMTGINKLFDFGECHSNVVIDGVYSALQSKYGWLFAAQHPYNIFDASLYASDAIVRINCTYSSFGDTGYNCQQDLTTYGIYANNNPNSIFWFGRNNLFIAKSGSCYTTLSDLGTHIEKMHFYGTATSGEGHANWANSVSYTQVTDINETIKTLHDQSSLTSLEQLHFKIFYCERHDNADTKLRTRTLLQNYVIADYVANVGSTWIQNILNQM